MRNSTDLMVALSFFLSTLALCLVAFGYMKFWIGRLRKARYDHNKNRAGIDDSRVYFESLMYDIDDRMRSSPERWKDANHLILSSQEMSSDAPGTKFWLSPVLINAGLREEDIRFDPKSVFVLVPFHPRYEKLYGTIRKICDDSGLNCCRGDEEYHSTDLFPHLLRLMTGARVIVAVVQGRSPNVMYELGIAHALGKKTIIVSQHLKNVPFDVKTKRLVLYSSEEELETRLRTELMKALV